MTAEYRYAVPFVSNITWTLNKVQDQVPVQDEYGNKGFANVPEDPNIKFTIGYYDGDEPLGNENFEFKDEKYASFLPAIAGVTQSWDDAFDSIREDFSITKTQPSNMAAIGRKFYMRLDRYIVNLDPAQSNSIVVLIGVYHDDKYTKIKSYKAVVALDGKTLRARQERKDNINTAIKNLEDIISGANPLDNLLPDDKVRAKDNATKELPARKAELAQLSKADGSITAMASLLGKPEVQQSVGLLCASLFTLLKTTDPAWAEIDVQQLMDPAIFKIPDIA